VLLREELLKENEIITKEDIYQKFAIYIENKDEKKLRQNIDSAVNSLVKLTFLKEIENGVYKIRNSVESFCNVKYLGEFDKKLEEYVSKLREKGV
jgi:transposase